MNFCRGHTTACLGPDAPTTPYGFGIYRHDVRELCAACSAVLIAMGMGIEPERRKSERRTIGAVA